MPMVVCSFKPKISGRRFEPEDFLVSFPGVGFHGNHKIFKLSLEHQKLSVAIAQAQPSNISRIKNPETVVDEGTATVSLKLLAEGQGRVGQCSHSRNRNVNVDKDPPHCRANASVKTVCFSIGRVVVLKYTYWKNPRQASTPWPSSILSLSVK